MKEVIGEQVAKSSLKPKGKKKKLTPQQQSDLEDDQIVQMMLDNMGPAYGEDPIERDPGAKDFQKLLNTPPMERTRK